MRRRSERLRFVERVVARSVPWRTIAIELPRANLRIAARLYQRRAKRPGVRGQQAGHTCQHGKNQGSDEHFLVLLSSWHTL